MDMSSTHTDNYYMLKAVSMNQIHDYLLLLSIDISSTTFLMIVSYTKYNLTRKKSMRSVSSNYFSKYQI